jgi:hypothetical protein
VIVGVEDAVGVGRETGLGEDDVGQGLRPAVVVGGLWEVECEFNAEWGGGFHTDGDVGGQGRAAFREQAGDQAAVVLGAERDVQVDFVFDAEADDAGSHSGASPWWWGGRRCVGGVGCHCLTIAGDESGGVHIERRAVGGGLRVHGRVGGDCLDDLQPYSTLAVWFGDVFAYMAAQLGDEQLGHGGWLAGLDGGGVGGGLLG